MDTQHRGMTLLETLMVLTIGMIVAVVATPMYRDYQRRAMYLDVLMQVSNIKIDVLEYYAVHGTWPKASNDPKDGRFSRKVFLQEHGEVVVVLEPKQYVYFRPYVVAGHWRWACRASTEIVRLLPVSCDDGNKPLGDALLASMHEWWTHTAPSKL